MVFAAAASVAGVPFDRMAVFNPAARTRASISGTTGNALP
jgi:hypothetical protein